MDDEFICSEGKKKLATLKDRVERDFARQRKIRDLKMTARMVKKQQAAIAKAKSPKKTKN
jgi:hypothetical protein